MAVNGADINANAARTRSWTAVAAGVAFVITLLIFWPCVDHGFLHWDDDENIVENEAYRGLGPRQLRWMFTTTHMGPYQPLSWVSLGLDYVLWGMSPRGYHRTSILIHSINAALAVWVTSVLLRAWRDQRHPEGNSSGPVRAATDWQVALPVGALTVGLLWAIHPMRVESVAWVTERRDVVCGLFYLLCIGCYLRGHDVGRVEASRRRSLWWAQLCCLLAILGKGSAASLPVVLLLLDVYPLHRLTAPVTSWLRPPMRHVLAEKYNYVLFSLFAVCIGFWGQWRAGGLQPIDQVGPIDRLALAGHAIVFYVAKTALPSGLSPMYARPVPLDVMSGQFLGSGLLVVGLTVALFVLRHRHSASFAAWISYVAMILPVSGIITIGHELVADRYSYLPALPICILLGGLLAQSAVWTVAAAGRAALAMGAVTILFACGLVTRSLIPVWDNDVSLWERAVAVNANTARAQTNLGGAYLMAGRPSAALEALTKAVALDPSEAKPHHNRGMALRMLGRRGEALQEFDQAIRLDPNHVLAHEWRGVTLTELDRPGEAITEFETAIRLARAPDIHRLRIRLADARTKAGQYSRAIAIYAELLKAKSPDPSVFAGLVETHLLAGQPERAEAVLADVPSDIADASAIRYALARVCSKRGRIAESLAILRELLLKSPELRTKVRVDPLLSDVRNDSRFDTMMSQVDGVPSPMRLPL